MPWEDAVLAGAASGGAFRQGDTMSSYDPREFGARCAVCALGPRFGELFGAGEWRPVGPECHSSALCLGTLCLGVGEAPGEEEVKEGRPFVGRAGLALGELLGSVGWTRQHMDLTNVVACRPPGNQLVELAAKVRAENERRRARQEELEIALPEDSCRERLTGELLRYQHVVPLGATAAHALGIDGPILRVRGGPREIGGKLVLPTLHPAFVLRSRRWWPVLVADLRRAKRWFAGRLDWREPERIIYPTPEVLSAWLSSTRGCVTAYDVETTEEDALTAELQCIGLATEDSGIVIPVRSVSGETGFYSSSDEVAIRELLQGAFLDGRQWLGHNAGYFDRLVMERWLGFSPEPLTDTILMARLANPELPKALGVVGSLYTDVTSWKAQNDEFRLAWGGWTDEQRWEYNLIDCVVTARIYPKLSKIIEERGQSGELSGALRPETWDSTGQPWTLLGVDHEAQRLCVGMHEQGVLIDQDAVRRLGSELRAVMAVEIEAVKARGRDAGVGDVNPASNPQVGAVLFTRWGLPPQGFTPSGDYRVRVEGLRELLKDRTATSVQRAWIQSVLRYRSAQKDLSFLSRLTPEYCDTAGRVHPHWNAHVTNVGRLSCSEPNVQTLPAYLRSVVIPAQGRVLVGADMEQLHLRIIANYWGVPSLREAFATGLDPHTVCASQLFGEDFRRAAGWGDGGFDARRKPSGLAGNIRTLAKHFFFASLYAAGVPTRYSVISTAEDKGSLKRELLFPRVTLRQVAVMDARWHRAEPGWKAAWAAVLSQYQEQGWLADPVFGRRSYFPDLQGVPSDERDLSDIVNFPVLAAEPAIMRLVEHRVMREIPFGVWGSGTGVILQVHDALVVECPEGEADGVKRILSSAMNIVLPAWSVPFASSAEAGGSWWEV